jgi:hypothetical protein
VNPDLDILWLNIDGGSMCIFENIHVRCDRYQAAMGDCDLVQERHKLVPKVAMNYTAWLSSREDIILLETLERFRVLELLIVVGDTDHIGIEANVVFITPRKSPKQTARVRSTATSKDQHVLQGTWSDSEGMERQQLLDSRVKHLPNLKWKFKGEQLKKERLWEEKLREEKRKAKREEKLKGQFQNLLCL